MTPPQPCFLAIALLLFSHIRCYSCRDFTPIRRYHPTTKFNSNSQDDLVTAEDVQYAYAGGESHDVVDFTKDHSVQLDHGHPGTVFDVSHEHKPSSIRGLGSTGLDVGHGTTGFDGHGSTGFDHGHLTTGLDGHDSTGLAHDHDTAGFSNFGHEDHPPHTGEVDLTASGSDLGLTSYDHPVGYSYGYAYGPPPSSHGYQYPPPKVPALPAITTPPPPPPAQEAKQSPDYTYYYLGRHLWYIPLYFSIYFIIYVGALVLKSVARHKIRFPENLKVAAQQARALRQLQEGERKFYM